MLNNKPDKPDKQESKEIAAKVELIEETLLKNVSGGIESCSVSTCMGGGSGEVCTITFPPPTLPR
jgi:hypothetical protein